MEAQPIKLLKNVTKDDVDNLAKAIGHFIMKFENMVERLRGEIMHMITVREIQDWSIIHILLADLTAEPILKKYEAMFHCCCTELKRNKEANELLKEIYNEVGDAIKYRNKIAHAHWFISFPMNWKTFEHEEARLVGKNARIKKSKGLMNSFDHDNKNAIDELNEWTKRIEESTNKILKLGVYVGKCEKTKFIKFG